MGASFFDFTTGTFSVIFLGEHSVRFYLLILSDLIFLIAVCNIISLGINNVIRFHYICNLEDKLAYLISQVSGEESLVNWMSFAAVINTKNIKHIFSSKYRVISLLIYYSATILAIGFCLFAILFQYVNLSEVSLMIRWHYYGLFHVCF